MNQFKIFLLFITLMPLLIVTAILVPFALVGILANIAMLKVSGMVNDFSREIEKLFRQIR